MRTTGRPSAPAPLRPDRRSETMRPHLHSPRPHRRVSQVAAAIGLGVLALTSCSLPGSGESAAAPPTPTSAAPAPTLTWSAADGGTVKAGDDLRVRVDGGTLQALDVVDQDGKALPASVAADTGTVADLPPSRTLTATVISASTDGTPVRTVRKVRTGAPPHALQATVTPGDDATVGIGQPIVVTFNSAVRDHAVAER